MRSRSGEHARPALGTLLDWGKALLGGMLDLALPPACLLCRSPLPPGAFLCDPCRAEVPFQDGSLCPGCGGGPAAGPFDFCRSCREKSYFRDGLVTLASFRGAARELIHSFKYRGDLGAGLAQARQSALGILHAGVMQHDHIGRAVVAPLAIVCGGDHIGNDR